LFQYGLAVTDYARQNPQGLDASNEPVEFYGYEWLQNIANPETCTDPDDLNTCKPFLGTDFSLRFGSIVLGDLAQDEQLYTVFNVIDGGISGMPDRLELERIEVGPVYKYAKTKDDGADGRQAYEIDLSLSSRAANYASEYRDQKGSGVVTYALSSYEEDGHIMGHPSTSGPNVDYGYLLTSGQNEMKGPVRFSDSTSIDQRKLTGVGHIEFSEGAAKTFKGFKHTGPKGRVGGVIPQTDVAAVASRKGNNTKEAKQAVSTGVNASEGFCFSAGYRINPHTDTAGDGLNTDYACSIFREDNNMWTVEAQILSSNAQKGDALTCYATCVKFNW